MTSGSPWSVKGIDPKAREIAKDLARRSGMTLGEWLNHVIYEDNAETPAGAPSLRTGAAPERPASENRAPKRSGDDLDRVLAALEDLSQRFEASAQEQADTTARFEAALLDLKADQAKVAARLTTVEQTGGATDPGKAQALRALEGALNKVAAHLATGEQRSRDSMAEMRREMTGEMMRVAEQVNLKVLEVENRSADAIAQVGAEVSRVATAVEQRLRRADDAQAEALEKLGGEIARITERLSERIAAAERRAAASFDDVGEQMARVTDRIHQRQERSESELAVRMRQSEERTAKLLEEARATIERRLGRPVAGPPPAEDAPAVAAESVSAFAANWTPVEPEAADIEAEAAAEPHVFVEPPALVAEPDAVEEKGGPAEDILEAAPEAHGDLTEDGEDEPSKPGSIPFQSYTPTLTADAAFTASDDLAALEAVANAIHELDEDDDADDDVFAPPAGQIAEPRPFSVDSDEQLRPSTRVLIEQARAAAYAEGAFRPKPSPASVEEDGELAFGSAFADVPVRRPKPANSMRGVLLAGGAVASIGLAATGYVALHPEIARLTGIQAPAKQPIPVGPASAPAPATQAAVALATAPTPKDDSTDLDAMYRDASAKVDANDPTGVEPLRTVANLGYAPAQRRLGKLYEDGGAGVTKDATEGRRWTQRAAANGDARGMHNLGLDYYEGSGGPKNLAVAAQWFQRAAELGLRDSQYNLARFKEAGIGLPMDLPGAYGWYLIAARAGDTEAQSRAETLKAKLTPEEQTRAQTLAAAFRPDPQAAPVSLTAGLGASSAKQLALAQRALAKLGYYKGAEDGAPSQALGEAIQSYQRARGLAANGQLSPELVQTFAHIAQ